MGMLISNYTLKYSITIVNCITYFFEKKAETVLNAHTSGIRRKALD